MSTLLLCASTWIYCILQLVRNIVTENAWAYYARNVFSPDIPFGYYYRVNILRNLDLTCTAMLMINVSGQPPEC